MCSIVLLFPLNRIFHMAEYNWFQPGDYQPALIFSPFPIRSGVLFVTTSPRQPHPPLIAGKGWVGVCF